MGAGIIINPAAGLRWRRRIGDAVLHAEAALRACSIEGFVRITEQRGSAREIARSMIVGGATTVVAWGGDGTINEVASEVVAAGATLGIVPAGSGNGFARGLGVERRVGDALRTALTGPVRCVDTGDIDGRQFVNVAGIGFDAHMADVFNRLPRRGAPAYFRAGFREFACLPGGGLHHPHGAEDLHHVRVPGRPRELPRVRQRGRDRAAGAPGRRPARAGLCPGAIVAVAALALVPALCGHGRPAAGDPVRVRHDGRADRRSSARVSRRRRGIRRWALPPRPRDSVVVARARTDGPGSWSRRGWAETTSRRGVSRRWRRQTRCRAPCSAPAPTA